MARSIKDDKAIISDNCVACGRCIDICPNDAIDLLIENEDFIKDTIKNAKHQTKNL